MDASTYFRNFYEDTKYRRGAGRARIALIRKICGIIRRMLLNEELYKDIKLSLYNKKLREYEKLLKIFEKERKSLSLDFYHSGKP